MKEIKTTALPYKYEHELHCNEVMLLPYYVASMNIEHEYLERTGEYKAFPGICLVDTFELAEPEQSKLSFMSEENTARVKRQKESPIFVIIGNPPYNAGQVDESDNNKNRKYPVIDARVSETYGRDSQATLLRKLQDPYLKAIRWATDRIRLEGIVCFVTNGSFIDDHSLDGVRASLGWDFDRVYVLDLGGNVRKNPKLSGTTHNVFGIQVGVSINLFVRKAGGEKDVCCPIRYASVDPFWRKEQKYDFLSNAGSVDTINWLELKPDKRHTWLTKGLRDDFSDLLPLAQKEKTGLKSIFKGYSLGVSTNRDVIAYGFRSGELRATIRGFIGSYNSEVDRFRRERPNDIDLFLKDSSLKWSRNLKRHLKGTDEATFHAEFLRTALYRPFTKTNLYLSDIVVDEPGDAIDYFSNADSDNRVMLMTDVAGRSGFSAIVSADAVDLHACSSYDAFQCFPFYTYDEKGSNRRENITDWALNEFRTHYSDTNITKWDIFHYVYAVLHHPEYRERYAANLKRELPRIPFVTGTADPSPPPPNDGSSARMTIQEIWVGAGDIHCRMRYARRPALVTGLETRQARSRGPHYAPTLRVMGWRRAKQT